jgi:hypothetical protein
LPMSKQRKMHLTLLHSARNVWSHSLLPLLNLNNQSTDNVHIHAEICRIDCCRVAASRNDVIGMLPCLPVSPDDRDEIFVDRNR